VFGVRLACAWPILIGIETIKLLRTQNVLDSERRIKLDSRSVKKLMLRSVFFVSSEQRTASRQSNLCPGKYCVQSHFGVITFPMHIQSVSLMVLRHAASLVVVSAARLTRNAQAKARELFASS